MHALRPLIKILVLALSFSAVTGCKVTSDDIEYWKRTVKGPGKIVAVMLAERYPIELRTQAGLALIEMERSDEDGVTMLQSAVARLKTQDPEAASTIVAGMVPGLLSLMQEGTSDEAMGPPLQQVRAKDAAYLLIEHAQGEARQQLVDGVVGWYAVDFANRSLSGNYSVEQVVRSLGAPAARQLVDAMTYRVPQQALVKIAELIGQIGDTETKQLAGVRLVEIETAMEGSEFIDWLKSEISSSLESQGRTADDDRVTNIAVANRERFINQGALPAMKHLASVEAVRVRLMAIASTAPAADLDPGSKEALNTRRTRALMALEGQSSRGDLETLLNIALDPNNPSGVQDYAFDRVADVRSPDAIPRLWPLVESASNEDLPKRLRWRAGELVLTLGGADIVSEFLSRLPDEDGAEFEPQELEGYATQMSQMTPHPAALAERQLSSPNWYARVIALRFIERRGSAEDAAKMERLNNDQTALVGDLWAGRELERVGQVAEAAVVALRERLAAPAEGTEAE